MEKRKKFDFSSLGKTMELDTRMEIDKTGRRKLNSSGNSVRVKHNPMLLWKHKNEISLRPFLEKSLQAGRDYLSEKILKEVDEMANTIKVIRDNQLEFLPVWVAEYCSESHCPTFNYIFDHQQIDCKEISNYWKSIKLEPEDNNQRDFINRTIKDYSVEIEGLGLKDGEWGLGYMEVIKKDDKEIILKSTHSEFTATIDLTSAKAIQEFGDMKIGDRFKVVATIGI